MVPVDGSVVGRSAVLVGTALATSRTRVSTLSSGSIVEFLTFGSSELRSQTAGVTLLVRGGGEPTKSQVTKDTSASGSAAGVCSSPATASDKSFCGLNGGMLAERSDAVSDRLPVTRT